MSKHKWHKEIKAWADGAEIESKGCLEDEYGWVNDKTPEWHEHMHYRIKPQPKEPQYLDLYIDSKGWLGIKNTDSFGNSLKCIGKIKLEQDDE